MTDVERNQGVSTGEVVMNEPALHVVHECGRVGVAGAAEVVPSSTAPPITSSDQLTIFRQRPERLVTR